MKHLELDPQCPIVAVGAFELESRVVVTRPALDFSSVYSQWFRIVYRWCRSLGGPSADAEDLVQDVFVIVQRRLPEFDGENIGGWLYAITRNVFSDHRRRSWFRRVILGKTPEQPDTASEGLLERKQAHQRFYRLVDRMNEKWRQPFLLYEVVGHSTDEVATLLQLPPATVRTHLHRARKQFLQLVANDLEKDDA